VNEHSTAKPNAKTLSVGVVGLGYWGPNLVRNFHAHADCRLKAVCDLSEERRLHMASLYPEAETFADFDAMLEEAELDAVVVAVPVQAHYELARKCLEAGKHVLIEKPMASSVRECEELIQLAEKKGLTLMVGHTFLYSEPVKRIGEIVKNGDIGDLLYINCQRLNLGLFQRDINVAWDLAPHDISIILHIFGKLPHSVNCQGNAHFSPGIEDCTNLSLFFPNRRFATIQSSWIEPRKVRQMTFVGSKRMIVYDDVDPLEKIRIYDVRVERPPHYDTFAEFTYSYYVGDSYIPRLQQEEPLKRLTRHFLDCIRTGEEPLTSGRRGLELVRILEASTQSLRSSGAPVSLESAAGKAEPRRSSGTRSKRRRQPAMA